MAGECTLSEAPSDDLLSADSQYFRRIEGRENRSAVTLVGVVHGHPASAHRVRRLVEAVDPDTVALELPSLAVALASVRARDVAVPPRAGGEMSAAVQAASGRVEGIDAPSVGYVRHLFSYCRHEGVSVRTLRNLFGDLLRSTRQSIRWRLAATIERRLGASLDVGRSDRHDVDGDEPLATLIENEDRHVSITRTFRNATETPASVDVVDSIREHAMAEHLDRLAAAGDVVAVVGLSHLDPIAEQLQA